MKVNFNSIPGDENMKDENTETEVRLIDKNTILSMTYDGHELARCTKITYISQWYDRVFPGLG